jgi:formylmethanofuran dehydrogenase subunit B
MYKEIVKEEDYEQIVRDTFEDDYKLFEWYHYITGDKDKALNDTIQKIVNFKTEAPNSEYKFFAVKQEDIVIGYFSIANNKILHSFGLHINSRTKQNLNDFVRLIKEQNIELCMLYSKNTRAINFLIKNGFVFQNEVEFESDKITILKN